LAARAFLAVADVFRLAAGSTGFMSANGEANRPEDGRPAAEAEGFFTLPAPGLLLLRLPVLLELDDVLATLWVGEMGAAAAEVTEEATERAEDTLLSGGDDGLLLSAGAMGK